MPVDEIQHIDYALPAKRHTPMYLMHKYWARKPHNVVREYIEVYSAKGNIVLDPFCGSGTILIAAERTGRKARALEIDPAYVDVAIRRWEQLTGKSATLSTGGTFEEISEQRPVEVDLAQVEAVASLGGGNHVGVL